MEKIKTYLVFVLIFGFISATSLVLCMMALTDISHGGHDMSIEWLMVRIFFVIFWLFTLFTIITVIKIFRSDLFKDRE